MLIIASKLDLPKGNNSGKQRRKLMTKMSKTVSKLVKKSEPKYFGFKVVRNVKGKLKSCSVGSLIVQYVTDKFVGPRTFGGPLTIFTNIYEAVGFIKKLDHMESMRVYRCEYIPTDVQYCGRFLVSGVEVKMGSDVPPGTIFARKVKLLKKVF